jgi:hypothetical protein
MLQIQGQLSYSATNGAGSALEALLHKLQVVLMDENKVLESQIPSDHESFIVKKNHLLRELMAVQRMDGINALSPEIKAKLTEVRGLVATNHRYLAAQVSAMTEITNMLTAVALAEDADGTYSRRQ